MIFDYPDLLNKNEAMKQKPLELLKRCILASAPEGAIVLDPFNGGGTTGIATKILGGDRKYIGIDIQKDYLDLTIKRYYGMEKNIQSQELFLSR